MDGIEMSGKDIRTVYVQEHTNSFWGTGFWNVGWACKKCGTFNNRYSSSCSLCFHATSIYEEGEEVTCFRCNNTYTIRGFYSMYAPLWKKIAFMLGFIRSTK